MPRSAPESLGRAMLPAGGVRRLGQSDPPEQDAAVAEQAHAARIEALAQALRTQLPTLRREDRKRFKSL